MHEAVAYRADDQSLVETVAYVRAALARDQPVLVGLPGGRLKRVRDGPGPDASAVRLVDIAEDGRNPEWIIPGILHPFVEDHPGPRAADGRAGRAPARDRPAMPCPCRFARSALRHAVSDRRDDDLAARSWARADRDRQPTDLNESS